MNIAEATIRYKVVSIVVTLFIIAGGIFFYDKLGRLEDPEFTIKDAQVITSYPGATAAEVEEEVTEKLETAIQEMGQLKEIKSLSRAGLSIITVTMKDKYSKKDLPQVWDELRRKVNDAQAELPPGVNKSIVYDDYGDVFGVLIAIRGEGFSYRELEDVSDLLKRELLQVPDVAKIVPWGIQQEQIFIEISRSRLKQLGISLDSIYNSLKNQNLVVNSGAAKVGAEYIRIRPSGTFNSVEDIKNIIINAVSTDKIIFLKDIANVSRGYVTPPTQHMRFNGERAIALGISTAQGGNVVKMGEALEKRLDELQDQIPLGIQLDHIYYQGDIVKNAVNNFLISLIEALAIVIVVLMIFMGLRSGILIGISLLLTVCGTLICMYFLQINLERISLGALIIALGMLVDNAIVVVEGMLIRIEKGMDRLEAAKEAVASTMWPLFGATVIAVLAFAAIGLSQDSTGEFLRSLFQVMFISLGLSWVIAITLTPFLSYYFLASSADTDHEIDPYAGFIFRAYRGFLAFCIRIRWITLTLVIGLLMSAMYSFTLLEDSFFPDSTSDQFMVHLWLPEGTDIRETSKVSKQVVDDIRKMPGIIEASTFVGAGAPRFMLVYSPEKVYSSYAFVLVKVKDYHQIRDYIDKIRADIKANYPAINPKLEMVRLGPGGGYSWEARFSGPDRNVLREISDQAKKILAEDGGAISIRDDWRNRVKLIVPDLNETLARRVGVSRADVANALMTNFTGVQVGLYRERDKLIPLVSRAPAAERYSIDDMYDVLVWSPYNSQMIPLRQVVNGIDTRWDDQIIQRFDKRRTITTQAEPRRGNVSTLFERVADKIEAIKLPVGYSLEWGGEHEDSANAQAGLSRNLPLTFILMLLVTIMLFNAIRQPLIIWLTVPLSIIGVSFGLLATNESFGFMALLGFLSLSGMLIKNAIVLIDEIDTQIQAFESPIEAVLFASTSRLRPVMMAAGTTILGMIPLLFDVFFKAMAITIMAGLAFATLLTLIIVPVFYAIFFKIKS